MEPSLDYIFQRLPLALLFTCGYILYRVIAVTGLPEVIAARAMRFSRGRADFLLMSLISVSAALSMFIPNAVTVLAMIPVIRMLDREFSNMTTPLTLSIIYGANIGGMGSLIGSPANLLLIGALDLFDIPGREHITFFNWFVWAVPLVLLMILLAWLVAMFVLPSRGLKVNLPLTESPVTGKQRQGVKLFGYFLCFWIMSSVLREYVVSYADYEYVPAALFTLWFISSILRRKVLVVPDLVQGVPVRGVGFLIMLGVLVVIVKSFGVDEYAASLYETLLVNLGITSLDGYTVYLVTCAVVILLTEFLSNTVVSTAFFAVLAQIGIAESSSVLPLLVLVSAASTCAFMTPVATPCNSLAVGEMRGVSLKSMFKLGLILNVLGSVVISIWVWLVVSRIY